MPKFRWLVKHYTDEIQSYLLRSPEAMERALPRFSAFLYKEREKDEKFGKRWDSLWSQHRQWDHKASKRRTHYTPGSLDEVSQGIKGAEASVSVSPLKGPSQVSHETAGRKQGAKVSKPPKVRRVSSSHKWEWDPTPPQLTTPFPKVGDVLPDAPVIPHPDLYASLQAKAVARWSRKFTIQSQAGRTRVVNKEQWYRKVILGDRGRGAGHAIFAIPSAKRLERVLQSLLDLRAQNSYTSALLLLPSDYILVVSDEVKTFLHAYCQKGEVYRYGKLFKRAKDCAYLHLNQTLTECVLVRWAATLLGSTVGISTHETNRKLNKLLKEFKDCVGDTFDRNKQPKTVPYVRLPVKADFVPHKETPFKKNPKITEITINDQIHSGPRREGFDQSMH